MFSRIWATKCTSAQTSQRRKLETIMRSKPEPEQGLGTGSSVGLGPVAQTSCMTSEHWYTRGFHRGTGFNHRLFFLLFTCKSTLPGFPCTAHWTVAAFSLLSWARSEWTGRRDKRPSKSVAQPSIKPVTPEWRSGHRPWFLMHWLYVSLWTYESTNSN